MPYVNDGWCFACGPHNPIGLHLNFQPVSDGVATIFTPQRQHQGYQGIMHGGLVATLLDEAVTYAIAHKFGMAVTGELTTRLHRPVPVALC
ncbi:MAG: PaaI family thioesterase [Chloroflexi bacterium]|nr:PaaI family thioesterase [Chloroflexota bacterium]MCL5075584.1 PaaI family thioesterase [Chloroflexota bacterium]